MKSQTQNPNKKELILNAALRIIAKQGLRGLTYRAVAKEAQVPLGLTSYYFKSIEGLYIAAYQKFVEASSQRLEDLSNSGAGILRAYLEAKDIDDSALADLIKNVSTLISEYVYSLVTNEREFRLMSMAFIHAALTIPAINESVKAREEQFNQLSENWFAQFGSPDPGLMADLLVGLVNHAEHRCLLAMNGADNRRYLNKTMTGFFELALGSARKPKQ